MSQVFEILARWAMPAAIAITATQSALYTVHPGHRGIIFDRIRGVLPEASSEGTHFLIPWFQKVTPIEVRTKPRNISTTTGSKDMQTVSLTLRVLHRPEVSKLHEIISNLGLDYEERVLPSIGNEVLKAVVAKYDASELITKRSEVSNLIRDDLNARAKDFNIVLEDVSITHLTFGKDFTAAVEQKVVAQQEAERAKFIVERAEQEKLASIIRSEGESHAAELLSNAYKKYGQAHLELRRIETSKEIVEKLGQSKNVTWLPSSQSGSNLLLKVGK